MTEVDTRYCKEFCPLHEERTNNIKTMQEEILELNKKADDIGKKIVGRNTFWTIIGFIFTALLICSGYIVELNNKINQETIDRLKQKEEVLLLVNGKLDKILERVNDMNVKMETHVSLSPPKK